MKYRLCLGIGLLFLSGVSFAYSIKPPIDEVYKTFYSSKYHFGNNFFAFQNAFLNMLLLFQVLSFIQYWNTRQTVYWHYTLYSLVLWLYFARAFPPYFYFLFSDMEGFRLFHYFLRPPNQEGLNHQMELIFFLLIMKTYLAFIDSFFEFKNENKEIHQKINWMRGILLGATTVMLLILLIYSDFYVDHTTILGIKNLCFLPALWLMYKIWRLNLTCANWILLGSSMLILGSTMVGVIRTLGIELFGQRVYLQLGVLAELLCFNAALGRLSWLLATEKARLKEALNEHQCKLLLGVAVNQDELLTQLDTWIETGLKRLATGEENLRFSIAQIADDLHQSSSTLLRRVSKLTGMSVEEYVLEYRLKHAHQLVLETQKSFGEIALLTGFGEHSPFSKAFKKKFGYSPSTLRKGGLSIWGNFEG